MNPRAPGPGVERLLRDLSPQVLGAVVRRYGHFDTAEDATQEALLAAAAQWPVQGVPDNPRAWLITVAARRLTDLLRSERARKRREDTVAQWVRPDDFLAPAADRRVAQDPAALTEVDDTLVLLFLCCHPALAPAARIGLTLRAVGGLTTAEIARAFLVPESTMTRRISRAKQQIRASGIPFALPPMSDERLGPVLHVLYLIFTEGYASTAGPELSRVELSGEAIRLTRLVHALLPGDPEVTGLLALMLLTDARRPARTDDNGSLVPMADQDRTSWDAPSVAEGVALITEALRRGAPGPYQLQAAIAALHDEAPTAEATDWPQILALYDLLLQVADNPVVRLNHAVATAMAGPRAGLARLDPLRADPRIAEDHRLFAVRGHLLEMVGDRDAARECYRWAALRTTSPPQQRYLRAQATRLAGPTGDRESRAATAARRSCLRGWRHELRLVQHPRPAPVGLPVEEDRRGTRAHHLPQA